MQEPPFPRAGHSLSKERGALLWGEEWQWRRQVGYVGGLVK